MYVIGFLLIASLLLGQDVPSDGKAAPKPAQEAAPDVELPDEETDEEPADDSQEQQNSEEDESEDSGSKDDDSLDLLY